MIKQIKRPTAFTPLAKEVEDEKDYIIAPGIMLSDTPLFSSLSVVIITLEVKNMIEAGIIDPVKVVTGSIYAATSIASVVLTSNFIITTDKEENKGVSLNMMPGGMM